MTKTVLVTGGAGFIGSCFVRRLYRRYPDYRIVVLDALTYAGDLQNLPVDINGDHDGRLSFWYGNVRNGELVTSLVSQANVVVHFAAETHVTRSIYDNFLFFETDVLGTQTVANAVVEFADRIDRFIHISTSEVYGTARSRMIDEMHPLMPMSPYASAKAGADRLVYSHWATYRIPAVIVRPFNNYGPHQHLEKVVPRFITGVLLKDKLRIHGTGEAARDFVYVEDTCEAIDMVMHAPREKVVGEVFNVGTGVDRTIKSVGQDIVRTMGYDPAMIEHQGDRPGQVVRHTADTAKIRAALGWQPRTSWDDGLKKTIKWYEDNSPMWRKQMWMRCIPIITANGMREMH